MYSTWFLYIPLAQLCVFSRNVHNEYIVYDRARTAIWSHPRPFAVNGGQSLTDSTEERENPQAAPPADAPSDAPFDAPSVHWVRYFSAFPFFSFKSSQSIPSPCVRASSIIVDMHVAARNVMHTETSMTKVTLCKLKSAVKITSCKPSVSEKSATKRTCKLKQCRLNRKVT